MSRTINLGQLISVGRGILMTEIREVHEILDYLTGDKLFTHQLPRAFHAVSPHLLAKYPFLNDIDLSSVNENNWESVLNELVKQYGNEFEIKPINNWQSKEPLSELAEMMEDRDDT